MGTPRPKRRFWHCCRVCFRWCRITILFLVFVLLVALVYMNQVGLPAFLKDPLLQQLHDRGLDLEFDRLHLSWSRGLVADRVRFGQADDPLSPRLMVQHARVELNHAALLWLKVQVDSVSLVNGQLTWPLQGSNREPEELAVENIQTHLRFLPGDEWALDNFRAQFAGAHFTLLGTITNASAIRDWKLPRGQGSSAPGQLQARLRQLADFLKNTQFSASPDFKLDVRGDARSPQSFSVRMMLNAPGADTPWGTVHDGRLTARLAPATNQELSRLTIELEAADAETKWANTTNFHLLVLLDSVQTGTNIVEAEVLLEAAAAHTRWAMSTNLHLNLRLQPVEGATNVVRGEVALRASRSETRWASASDLKLMGTWTHSLTNPIPLDGDGTLSCARADSPWASADDIEFSTTFGLRTNAPKGDLAWAWWTNLAPYGVTWNLASSKVASSNTILDKVLAAGNWAAPNLEITNLSAEVESRQLQAHASLDIETRALGAHLESHVNPHRLGPLLPEGARRWLAQFTWKQPPDATGDITVVLPAWTNSQPDWREEVQPTLKLSGQFAVDGGGTYRLLSASGAKSHFFYTNMCWFLPDLVVLRPEGSLHATHQANDRTKDFYWKIRSTLDPNALRPALGSNEARGLDIFEFTEPPLVEAEIRGRSRESSLTGFQGRLAVTNITVRGQWFSGIQAAVSYTNNVLRFLEPQIQRGTQHLRADGLSADFTTQFVYLTNGSGVAEPLAIARAIGSHVGEAIEPYEFAEPVNVTVSGTIPMHGEEGADLRFTIDGGRFHWDRFHVPKIAGDIHWAGLKLELSKVRVDFYGGKAVGAAEFDFNKQTPGTDYSFALTTTDTVLQDFMADYFHRTNSLEGALTGNLVVTKANSADWRKTVGYGNLSLRDGYIWDVPIFGVFSPILDGIIPGLGKSRASSANCTFTINNGIIHSSDLEARAPALRLQYRGDLDLEGNVKARVEGELLRDVWLVGPLVSTVFWPVTKMFEYQVTGTVGEPKIDPVYVVPKLLTLPFVPFRSLKGLLPDDSSKGQKKPPSEEKQP